ncbi:Uncharacterized protein TCM_030001 [Theobroma cacao]|uniref:Uncharacterized protein n=1 Tax=Theobroma cacao TaxID=3641 RepID=A0A061GGY7_THECC|nr:Uncharacterized protein TCM_030001 [Theobroma cacao]
MQRNQKNTLFFGLSFCNKRTANDLEKQKGFSNFFQTSKIAVAMLMNLRCSWFSRLLNFMAMGAVLQTHRSSKSRDLLVNIQKP